MAPLKLVFTLQGQFAGFSKRLTQCQFRLCTLLHLLVKLIYQLVTVFELQRQCVPVTGEGVFLLLQVVAVKNQYQQGQQQYACQ